MGTIIKCPHCKKHLIIESSLKIDVQVSKLNLEEEKTQEGEDNGNEPSD